MRLKHISIYINKYGKSNVNLNEKLKISSNKDEKLEILPLKAKP